MFRLSQNLSSIIVDESIKKAVELAKIPMVRFLTQDVAIFVDTKAISICQLFPQGRFTGFQGKKN